VGSTWFANMEWTMLEPAANVSIETHCKAQVLQNAVGELVSWFSGKLSDTLLYPARRYDSSRAEPQRYKTTKCIHTIFSSSLTLCSKSAAEF
jgi:hypothetical protein